MFGEESWIVGRVTCIRKYFFFGAKYLQRKGSVWGGVMDSGRVVWDDSMVEGHTHKETLLSWCKVSAKRGGVFGLGRGEFLFGKGGVFSLGREG